MKHRIAVCIGLTLLSAGVLCLGLAPVAWAGGGASANAQLCQQGGWQSLLRSDGSSFANQGACVSYGAQGGTLETHSQLDCGSFGGTFTQVNSSSVIWACDGWTTSPDQSNYASRNDTLFNDCTADGGTYILSVTPGRPEGPYYSTCYQPGHV